MKEKQTRRKKRHSLTLGESKRLGACTERLSQSVSKSVFCRFAEKLKQFLQPRSGSVAAEELPLISPTAEEAAEMRRIEVQLLRRTLQMLDLAPSPNDEVIRSRK